MQQLDRLFILIGDWFHSLLAQWLPEPVVSVIGMLLSALIIMTIAAVTMLYMTYLERKVVARIQDRIGPNRVGPFGLLQPLADGIKMFTKEMIVPTQAHKVVYNIAPVLAVTPAMMAFAVIPFGRDMVASDLDIGLLYLIAVSSVTEIAIVMGGWASRNKYSLLGGMRAAAQMLSYEIPMVLVLLSLVLMVGSLRLSDFVDVQTVPFILLQPFAFIVFLISAAAEVARSPFDIPEAESELIAGYHTEYGGMRFALFQMAEFVAALGMACIMVTLFLGGWRSWIIPLPSWLWFVIKTFVLINVWFWFRGTFPRLRIDQLQALAWKFLVPASLLHAIMTAVLVTFFPLVKDGQLVVQGAEWLTTTVVYFVANVVLLFVLMLLYRPYVRRTVRQLRVATPAAAARQQEVQAA